MCLYIFVNCGPQKRFICFFPCLIISLNNPDFLFGRRIVGWYCWCLHLVFCNKQLKLTPDNRCFLWFTLLKCLFLCLNQKYKFKIVFDIIFMKSYHSIICIYRIAAAPLSESLFSRGDRPVSRSVCERKQFPKTQLISCKVFDENHLRDHQCI